VPEIWRYDGGRFSIPELKADGYDERATSLALPPLTADVNTRFAKDGAALKRRIWMRRVREWARRNTGRSG
jgi:hypothetical protein